MTQRLGIAQICATTPQAKGRVERANKTLQDRLLKEMRLACIRDMAAAQAFQRLLASGIDVGKEL